MAERDVNAPDADGLTPLHRAADKGSFLGVHTLLKAGARPNVCTRDGVTPLHLAADRVDSGEVVTRLLDGGANPNMREAVYGHTPLHLAALSDSAESVNRLLQRGADPNARDGDKETPLHFAASASSPAVVSRLLAAGADPNARDLNGDMPLHDVASAPRDGSLEVSLQTVERLIAGGANPNARDEAGNTPLHGVAEGHTPRPAAMVRALLAGGADPGVKNGAGRTAIEVAAEPRRGSVAVYASAVREVLAQRKGQPFDRAAGVPRREAATMAKSAGGFGTKVGAWVARAYGRDPQEEGDTINHRPLGPDGQAAFERALDRARRDPLARATLPEEYREAPAPRQDAPPADRAQNRARGVLAQRKGQQFERAAGVPRREATTMAKSGGGFGAKVDAYNKEFADRMIEALKKGTAPWQKPWAPGEQISQQNFSSKNNYRGGNSLYLSLTAAAKGYTDPRWGGYRQISEAGGHVKKGEKGTPIMYVDFNKRTLQRDDKGQPKLNQDGHPQYSVEKRDRPMVKMHMVFNVQQSQGLKLPPMEKKVVPEWEAHKRVEAVMQGSGIEVVHQRGDRAFYQPKRDRVVLPARDQFPSQSAYSHTALHELGHATGHKDRLNRPTLTDHKGFGTPTYAREELRAEMAAMMSGERLGVGHEPRHGEAYVKSWIKAVENDPKEIRMAAVDAQRASDWLIARERTKEQEREQPAEGNGERKATGRLPDPPAPTKGRTPDVPTPAQPEVEQDRAAQPSV